MNFQAQGQPLNRPGMDQVCQLLGVKEASVWAVLSVETRGFGFLADRRPQILFERHIFHSHTGGRYDAQAADISNTKPGGYVGGSGEYERLERAMALDSSAALASTSWGIGQIMGFNYAAAGYSSVEEMVAQLCLNEDNQLQAMARFITSAGLASALQRGDWQAFARGYNGPAYEKNQYDQRLAAAYAKSQQLLPDLTLRAAQAALLYLKLDPGPIDGLHGRRTHSALMQYQERAGLPGSGELDETTAHRLLTEAFPPPATTG